MVFTDKAIESLCRKNEAGKSGFYPVGKYNCWHSGIHLTTDAAITPVIRGTIVSFKISEKYEELSDDRKCPSSFILIKHSVSLPAGKNKAVLEFFTFYTLIRPDTESAPVKKYSNTFVVLDEKLSERTPFYREWKFRVNSNKTKSYYIYDGNEDIFEGSEGYIDDQNFLGAGHYTNDGYQCKMGVLEKNIFVRSGYFKVKDPNALILVKPKNAGVKYFRVEADNLRDENASGTVKNNTVKAYQEPVYIKGIKCLTLKGSGAENFKHNEKNGYVYVSEITKHIPNSIYAYAKKDKTYFYNIELITENAKQYFTVCVYKDFEAMKREITELSTIRLLFTNWNLLLNRNNLIRDLDAQFKDDTEDIGCIDPKRLVLIYNEEYTWVPEGSVPDTDKDYYDVLVFEEMVAPYRIYLKSTLFKAIKEYMEKSKEGQRSVRKVFRKLEPDKSAKLHVCRINRRSDYIQNPENMELNEEDIKVCVTGNILMRAKSRIREKEYSKWIVRAEDMNLVKGPAIKMSERTASLKRYTVSKKRGLMLYNMVSGAPEKIIGAGDEILLMDDSDEFLMSDEKPVRKEVVVGDKRYHAYIDSRDCLEGKLVIKQRFMEGGSFFGKIITKEIPISPYDCLGYGTEYNFSAE